MRNEPLSTVGCKGNIFNKPILLTSKRVLVVQNKKAIRDLYLIPTSNEVNGDIAKPSQKIAILNHSLQLIYDTRRAQNRSGFKLIVQSNDLLRRCYQYSMLVIRK